MPSLSGNLQIKCAGECAEGLFDSEITRALASQLTEAHATSEYDWRWNPRLVAERLYQQVSHLARNTNVITYSINNMLDLLSTRAAQSSISLTSREDHGEALYALCEGMVNFNGMLNSFTTGRFGNCVPSTTDWGMEKWRQLVMCAVESGNAGIVEDLLNRAAILSGDSSFCELELPFTGWWLESDENEESFDLEILKQAAFLEAARSGREKILRCLLKLGVDIDVKDHKSRTPLLLATAPGFYDCVKLLLENGVSVKKCNMSNSGGVLGLAVEKYHIGIVRLLLEYAALDPQYRLPEEGRADMKFEWRGNSCKHGPLIIWMSRKGIWMHWQEVMRMTSEVYGLDPDCECLRRYDETGIVIRVD
ncbi:ankyrin [Mytilinidion resinicola]|uniref:Ankyrin n=1 Tax=Mytilinidion resinicola TaxID=574789 RepID=A0A6A6YBK6_9PEZI|nr:ankyrin [Mytilinidion resinicola]KAF2806192.1 ankyrin [Mytilinidion resinicola]